MRHLLADPAFPDIVGQWAKEKAREKSEAAESTNDNKVRENALTDPLLALVARAQVEATRLW